jgi:hypothetical protein
MITALKSSSVRANMCSSFQCGLAIGGFQPEKFGILERFSEMCGETPVHGQHLASASRYTQFWLAQRI